MSEALIVRRGGSAAGTIYLYNAGDENTSLTGGWSAKGWTWNSYFVAGAPTVEKGTSVMTIRLANIAGTDSASISGVVHIANDIDLTNYKVLTALFTTLTLAGTMSASPQTPVSLCVLKRSSTTYLSDSAARVNCAAFSAAGSKSSQTLTVDVSSLSGSYDIAIALWPYSESSLTMTAVLSSVKLA